MDDELPFAAGQDTPTPASHNARSAKNREKAIGKRKRRMEKRRKSENPDQSAQQSDGQDLEPDSSQKEVEDLLQSSNTGNDETSPAPESLLDTFHPEIVEGFAVSMQPHVVCHRLLSNRRIIHPSSIFRLNTSSLSSALLTMFQKYSSHSATAAVRSISALTRARIEVPVDWHRTVTLIDPSNLEKCGGILYDTSRPIGLKATMFNKYQPWVPAPDPGDILLLIDAKVSVSKGPFLAIPRGANHHMIAT